MDRIVASDDKSFRSDCNCTSFDFSEKGIAVSPDFNVMTKYIVVKIIEKDGFLAVVTVPPFILQLEVRVRKLITSAARFANAGRSPKPDAANVI